MIIVNARFLTQEITGVQRFGIEISLELKKLLKDEIKFVSPYNIKQEKYAKALEGVVIGKHKGHVWEQLDLPLYLKKYKKPLLLNLANTAPVFYKNKISTIHDIAFEVYPQTFSKTFLYIYKFLIPRIIESSKHVITVSEFSRREISGFYHIDKNKISVIYNAVNTKFKHAENLELKSKRYFLAVSSLNYRKNFVAVLKAFNSYSQSHTNEQLYIIGDVRNKNFKGIDISEFVDNPKIKFLGRVSDDELVSYYSNALAFIYPSLYEGFGIPPLEAQTCGCPVICSSTTCLPEVFKDSVLYCDPYDVNNIVEKMRQIVEDENLRGEIIACGYKNAYSYEWSSSAKSVSSILESMK